MAYIISVHIPIAGMSLIPVVLGWPIILYPVHIVLLELIIDPACSIVFESEAAEKNIMQRLPRDPKESLFSKRMLFLSFLQGVFSLVVVIVVFQTALRLGQGEAGARTLAFITLVVSNICLILTNRSWSRSMIASFSVANKSLAGVIAGVVIFLFSIVYVHALQRLFHFDQMHWVDLLICLAAGILSVLWFELAKAVFSRMKIDLMKI
jgi:Ca2+-transporting ATPase